LETLCRLRCACDHCAGTAVTENTTLREIFLKVRDEMIDFGVDVSSASVTLGVALDQSEIAAIANLYHRVRDAATEVRPTGNGQHEYHIYVIHGLPREVVESTLAHEIMHIFLVEHQFPRRISPMVVEGLAEYASYMYITHDKGQLKGDEEYRVDQIKNNEELICGTGFVACDDAVKLTGSFMEVLKHVKRTRWFPHIDGDVSNVRMAV